MTVPNGWTYRTPDKIGKQTLHIEVIADYGGKYSTDHAFAEVRNHFFRFDTKQLIYELSEHPVYAFSTIETGFWIAQEALHSQHNDLVIFSNTAPRGDIAWHGEKRQSFVCGLLDNGIPLFVVNAGYNLSFVKDRLTGLWDVNTPNEGTQFRSRDYYPEATMAILQGELARIGEEIDVSTIPDVPEYSLASVDGYGNLKTTIRAAELPEVIKNSSILRVTLNKQSYFVLNTLQTKIKAKMDDICLVSGSSGGKGRNYVELVRIQGRAADTFGIDGPKDDLGKIVIEPV